MRYFNYQLFNSNIDKIFINDFESEDVITISTINPHSFVVAEKDLNFKRALINSDFLLVDGVGIRLILLLKLRNVKLINGPFLHSQILYKFNNKKLRVFYMGSTEFVLDKIKEKLNIQLPIWEVETYSPPFVNIFSNDQNDCIIENINKFKPDILFIGMTAPKQEKWVDLNKHLLKAKYIVSIGAVFDFYSGYKKSAPKLIAKLNLIWAYRLFTDFKHVWKRTFISFPLFIYYNVINSIKK